MTVSRLRRHIPAATAALLRGLALALLLCLPAAADAQGACDRLMANGVKAQQTMTVASQKMAIAYFEKAKACYDSNSRKALCDEQITACRNIIKQLSQPAPQATTATATPAASQEPVPPAWQDDVIDDILCATTMEYASKLLTMYKELGKVAAFGMPSSCADPNACLWLVGTPEFDLETVIGPADASGRHANYTTEKYDDLEAYRSSGRPMMWFTLK